MLGIGCWVLGRVGFLARQSLRFGDSVAALIGCNASSVLIASLLVLTIVADDRTLSHTSRTQSRDYWRPMSTVDAPTARGLAAAIWTGREMIVWGGHTASTFSRGNFDTVGAYNPATDSWRQFDATGVANGPTTTIVWTGREMIVCCNEWASRGRYDPATDTWSPLHLPPELASRIAPTATWTGTEVIFWGGQSTPDQGPLGFRFNPDTAAWTPMNGEGEPSPRWGHTAIWTGTELVVWGGFAYRDVASGPRPSGARYNPLTDRWQAMTMDQAPSPRGLHAAVWTGREMLIFGGGGAAPSLDAARYDPAINTWRPMAAPPTVGANTLLPPAIWTGQAALAWLPAGDPLGPGTMWRYDLAQNLWQSGTIEGAPVAPRRGAVAVWTGAEAIVWGGGNLPYRNDGGRYTPPPLER